MPPPARRFPVRRAAARASASSAAARLGLARRFVGEDRIDPFSRSRGGREASPRQRPQGRRTDDPPQYRDGDSGSAAASLSSSKPRGTGAARPRTAGSGCTVTNRGIRLRSASPTPTAPWSGQSSTGFSDLGAWCRPTQTGAAPRVAVRTLTILSRHRSGRGIGAGGRSGGQPTSIVTAGSSWGRGPRRRGARNIASAARRGVPEWDVNQYRANRPLRIESRHLDCPEPREDLIDRLRGKVIYMFRDREDTLLACLAGVPGLAQPRVRRQVIAACGHVAARDPSGRGSRGTCSSVARLQRP